MGSKSKQKKAATSKASQDGTDAMSKEVEVIREDDTFFAKILDLVPRRFLIPLSDDQKDLIHEKQLKARTTKDKGKKRENSQDDSEEPGRPAKRKRDFNNPISNAEAIEDAARKQAEKDKEIAQQYLKSETLAPVKKLEDSSIAQLRARLQTKIETERGKGGVPGARAERDKLLPPKQPRPESMRNKALTENTTDDVESNGGRSEGDSLSIKSADRSSDTGAVKKPSKKEELEAKISFGVLKLGDDAPKLKDGKPMRSKTSTSSIINVKKLIKEAEKSQARMEALKAQGKNDVVQQERWDTLEKKAAGEKIRDDPKLLKKSLKSLEKKKVKSAHEWQDRKKQQDDELKDRIEHRQKNIDERKSKKIEKRGGAVKKDEEKEKRRRPGFEGANAPWKKGGSDGGDKKRMKPEGGPKQGGGKPAKSPFSKKSKVGGNE